MTEEKKSDPGKFSGGVMLGLYLGMSAAALLIYGVDKPERDALDEALACRQAVAQTDSATTMLLREECRKWYGLPEKP